MAGLLTIDLSSDDSEMEPISKEENKKNRDHAANYWAFGPAKTAGPNTEYWKEMAIRWKVKPEEAKRQLCANCEYFDDSPDMMKMMENVPLDVFDKDGGGRGYCHKFDFVCGSKRVCMAWDGKSESDSESDDE
jgi:hypothetical protein